jgi:hypothetical protein
MGRWWGLRGCRSGGGDNLRLLIVTYCHCIFGATALLLLLAVHRDDKDHPMFDTTEEALDQSPSLLGLSKLDARCHEKRDTVDSPVKKHCRVLASRAMGYSAHRISPIAQ